MEGVETVEPVQHLLKPYIIRGGGSVLFAPPGSGKSWLLLMMAVSIDAGIGTHWDVTQAKVLVVNLERSKQSVRRRLAIVNNLLGLPQTRPLLFINAKGQSLSRLAKAVKRTVLENGVQVVLLDSISRAGAGSLIKDDVANSIIDTLHGICDTWLAIAHSPREDASHLYGSVHFDAGQDIGIKVVSEQRDNKLIQGLEIVKANDIRTGQRRVYELQFSEDSVLESFKTLASQFGNHLFQDKTRNLLQEAVTYLENLDDHATTPSVLAQSLKISQGYATKILQNTEFFTKLPRQGHEQPYGLVSPDETPPF